VLAIHHDAYPMWRNLAEVRELLYVESPQHRDDDRCTVNLKLGMLDHARSEVRKDSVCGAGR
jgi:hypothetical protein